MMVRYYYMSASTCSSQVPADSASRSQSNIPTCTPPASVMPSASTLVNNNISIPSNILKTLREKVESMPKSVPLAKKTGPIAGYCCNPAELTKDIILDVDVWEMWDPRLNSLISHRISENHPLITRGKYGLIALVHFLEHLVRDRKVDEGLLEGKIGRIIEAIDRYCFCMLCPLFLLLKLIVLVSASHTLQMFPPRSFPSSLLEYPHPKLLLSLLPKHCLPLKLSL